MDRNQFQSERDKEDLRRAWNHFPPWKRQLIVLTARLDIGLSSFEKARPIHFVLPAMLGQFLSWLFASSMQPEDGFSFIVIANLVIVGLALSPVLFRSPKHRRYHWVRPPE